MSLKGAKERLEEMHKDGTLSKLLGKDTLRSLLPPSSQAMAAFLESDGLLSLRLRAHVFETFNSDGTFALTHARQHARAVPPIPCHFCICGGGHAPGAFSEGTRYAGLRSRW